MRVALRALLAALVAVGWAAVGPPAATAHATGTICVALVVDDGDLGGGVSTTCARVPAGSSGSDVLSSAHHVTFDPRYGDDFVCAIDGKPAGGCSSVDGTHYWAYYHRAPGGSAWTISQEGAGSYQPRNGSTEGWVYDDGASTPPRPADVPYDDICPKTPAPSPTASRAVATATGTPTATRAARPAAATATTTATTRATTTTTATRSPARRPRPAVAPATPRRSATPTADPTATTRARDAARTLTASPGHAGGPPTGLLAGVAAAALLGGAAWWRSRRSRG